MDFSSCKYHFLFLFSSFVSLYVFAVLQNFFHLFPLTEHCAETTLRRHRVSPRSSVRDRRLRRAVQAQFCGVSGLHRGRGRGLVHRRHHECPPRPRRCHHTRRFVVLIRGSVPKMPLKWDDHFPPHYFCLHADMIYVAGGFDGSRRHTSMERYDPNIDQWSMLGDMQTAREGAGLVVASGLIYCLGKEV